MNWTGGHLSRHSRNSKNSLTQRQKQHFAEARSNLLKGSQKRSPIKWELFEPIEKPAREDGSQLHPISRHSQNDQVKSGPELRERLSKGDASESILDCQAPQATSQSNHNRLPDQGPCEWLSFDREVMGDEFHRASPSSYARIGKQDSQIHKETGRTVANHEVDSLEERRQRILRRIDWVGANFQRPLKLKYTISGNSERLGKRRKVTVRHQNQTSAIARPMVMSSLTKTIPKQKPRGSCDTQSVRGEGSGALPNNHVRISIGGRHAATGIASSISQGKSVGGHLAPSRASISDEMLLDGDDMSRQQSHLLRERRQYLADPGFTPLAPWTYAEYDPALSPFPTGLHMHTPHRRKVLSSCERSSDGAERHSATISADLDNLASVCLRQNNFSRIVAQGSDEHIEDQYKPNHQHDKFFKTLPSNVMILPGHKAEEFINSINRTPVLKPKPIDEYQFTNVPGQFRESARDVFSVAQKKLQKSLMVNSQPELRHPIPLSSRTSNVLTQSSSDSGSNVAQINAEPFATPSQKLDEEIWKTWILSSQSYDELEKGVHNSVSISPGISNLEYPHIRSESKPTSKENSDPFANSMALSANDDSFDGETERQAVENSRDIEDIRKEALFNLPNLNHHDDLQIKPAVDYENLFLSHAGKIPSQPKPKPVQPKNPDEAWMKFILSDNDEDPEHDTMQPLVSPKTLTVGSMHCLSTSSVIVHLSGKHTSSSQPESTIARLEEPDIAKSDNADFSTNTLDVSNRTTQDYSSPSSHGLSQQPSSLNLICTPSTPPPISTPLRPIRKLTFTKPPRFRGQNRHTSPDSAAATVGSPIHIGRRFPTAETIDKAERRKSAWASGSFRKQKYRERDIYSLEKAEDEVESIEDD